MRRVLNMVFLLLMVPWYALLGYYLLHYWRQAIASPLAWLVLGYLLILPIPWWHLRSRQARKGQSA